MALASASISIAGLFSQCSRLSNCTPAAPVAITICASSTARARSSLVAAPRAVTSTPKRFFNASQAACARSWPREHNTTSAPSRVSMTAARWPTGPVPPRMTTFFSLIPPVLMSLATAAAAVVLLPLLSSMTDTRKSAKNTFCTASSSFSPATISLPPINRAVFFFSFGLRVKMAPSTSARTFSGVQPP